VAFRLLRNLDLYAYANDLDTERQRYRLQLSNYGYNPISQNASVDLFENFQALLSALDKMYLYGQIKNRGILNSIKTKIEGAQQILEKQKEKGKTPAINKLSAAAHEIQGQTGKQLDEDGLKIIQGFINSLIAQIKDKTF